MKGIDGPELEKQLREPDHERVFAVAAAFKKGWSVDRVHDLTKIDRWYLHKLKHINDMLVALEETKVRRVCLLLLLLLLFLFLFLNDCFLLRSLTNDYEKRNILITLKSYIYISTFFFSFHENSP